MNIKIILIIFAVLLVGCQAEKDMSFNITSSYDAFSVAKARVWYEQKSAGFSTQQSNYKSAGENGTLFDMKPLLDWNLAELNSDSVWEVVELPWEYADSFIICTSDVYNYSEASNAQVQQVVRLIVVHNKQTGDIYGGRMLVLPYLDYMIYAGDSVQTNKYLTRNSQLSGLVLFYSLDNHFINGWKYSSGTITGRIQEIGSEEYFSMLSNSPPTKALGGELDEVVCVGAKPPEPDYFYLKTLPPIDNTGRIGSFYGGMGGGGGSSGNTGGSGDSGGNTQPETNDDCPESAGENSERTDNILDGADDAMDELRGKATGSENEWSTCISQDNGIYSGSALEEHNTLKSSVGCDANVEIVAHSHHSGVASYTTPGDAIALAEMYKSGSYPLIYGSVATSANGAEYLIYISNYTALSSFCSNPANSDFFLVDDGYFQNGTVFEQTYNAVKANLFSQKYSSDMFNIFALAYVLDYFNTGMKVQYRSSASGDFKELNTEKSNSNYKPSKCK